MLWWHFEWSEEWTPDSITTFGWVVKIRSIHEDESPIICVGSLIIYSNPNWEVTPSILEPSYVVMSLLYQRLVFTFKSPRTKRRYSVRKGFYTITESRFNSKLLINDSKSSWHWLGEWYNVMKLFLQVMDNFNCNWKRNVVVNDDLPYVDYNLDFVNYYHQVKWMNREKSLIDI